MYYIDAINEKQPDICIAPMIAHGDQRAREINANKYYQHPSGRADFPRALLQPFGQRK